MKQPENAPEKHSDILIYQAEDGELIRDSVVADYATTAADGKRYRAKHYNLDMILAVGYRVRSPRGVQFRQWATERTIKKRLIVQTEGARERLHRHDVGLQRRDVSQQWHDARLHCLIGSVICRIVSQICHVVSLQWLNASIIHGKSSLQQANASLKYHEANQQSLFAGRQNHHETLPAVSFSCISCVSWSKTKATP